MDFGKLARSLLRTTAHRHIFGWRTLKEAERYISAPAEGDDFAANTTIGYPRTRRCRRCHSKAVVRHTCKSKRVIDLSYHARPAFPRMLLPLLIARGYLCGGCYPSTEARLLPSKHSIAIFAVYGRST